MKLKNDGKDPGTTDPDAGQPAVKSPLELIPKLLASAYSRALSWAYARQVAAKTRLVPRDEAAALLESGDRGLSLAMRVGDKLLLQWLFPAESWTSLLGLWNKIHPGDDAKSPKLLMQLLGTPLELMAYLTHENMGADLESGWERRVFVPLASNWDAASRDGLRWALQDCELFEVGLGNHRFFVLWDGTNLRRFTRRLVTENAFRSLVNEQVLGRYSGREGAERLWFQFPGTRIALNGDFPLGTLLLPVLQFEGRSVLPQFTHAEIGPLKTTGGAALQRKMLIAGNAVQLLYVDEAAGRSPPNAGTSGTVPLNPDASQTWLEILQRELPGSGPYAGLFGDSAIQDSIARVQLNAAQGPVMLQLSARYVAGQNQTGAGLRIAVPAGFLSLLSTYGSFPWDWRVLMDGADSLLLLLLSVNEKLRRHPPRELMAFAGGNWSQLYYRQSAAQSNTILVAELLAVAPREDRIRIVQNCIVPEQKGESTFGLFYFQIGDDPNNPQLYKIPTFQEADYLDLLPKQQREDWHRSPPAENYDKLIAANTRVMTAVFRAFAKGDLELSWKPAHILNEVFARRWHDEQVSRAAAVLGGGFAADIASLSKTQRRGSALIAAGPRLCAHALALDPPGAALVKRPLVSAAFEKEFRELVEIHKPKLEALAADYGETITAIEHLRSVLDAELRPKAG